MIGRDQTNERRRCVSVRSKYLSEVTNPKKLSLGKQMLITFSQCGFFHAKEVQRKGTRALSSWRVAEVLDVEGGGEGCDMT